MKIGFVLDDSLDVPDGVQQYLFILGKWLSANGHEVRYLVGNTKRTDIEGVYSLAKNIKVSFNGNKLTVPLPASKRRIREVLEAEKFDVLHVQLPFSPLLAGRVVGAAHGSSAVVGTFHILPNSALASFGSRLLAWWSRKYLRMFDEVVSVSTAAQQFADEVFNIKSRVVPNMLDIGQFQSMVKPVAKSGKAQIVFLGRLVPRKGCDHLIESIGLLKNKMPKLEDNLQVTVYGKGAQAEPLQKRAKQLGLEGIISFAGFVSETDKPTVLGTADIVVYPSTGGESFGLVLVEAMAAGAGVVLAGNNPGYKSVLGSLPNCLFDPKNHQAFANTLLRFAEDKKLRAALHEAQQKLVKQYDVGVVGPQVVDMYAHSFANRKQNKHNKD